MIEQTFLLPISKLLVKTWNHGDNGCVRWPNNLFNLLQNVIPCSVPQMKALLRVTGKNVSRH